MPSLTSTNPIFVPTRATIWQRPPEFLRSYPQIRVTIEGHCDERGSTEYNIGLGERRAQAAKNYLISLGISADQDGYGQLGQRAAILHRARRIVLATKPACAFRSGALNSGGQSYFESRRGDWC